MNPLAVPLPAAVIRRGDVVGLITGIASFPMSLHAGSFEGFLTRGPGMIVLPIVILSALAGAIASALTDPATAPNIGGMPMRVGVRAGFLAAVVGGAFSVFASTLHPLGIGSPTTVSLGWFPLGGFLPSSAANRVILLTLLALPPSIFFGLAGALLAGMLKNPGTDVSDGAVGNIPAATRRSWACNIAIFLTILGYLSPLLVVLKPVPKPRPNVANASTPTPALPIAQPAPTPKWTYKKPEAFNSVEPSRIAVTDQRSIGEVSQQHPMAISPDGLHFAFFRPAPSKRIEVINLETLDVIASVPTGEEPTALTWSPNSTRLCFATEGERRSVIVFDVKSSRFIDLPKPLDSRVPNGSPVWRTDSEVHFVAPDGFSILNLETLRVLPPKSEAQKSPTSLLAANPRWQMRVENAVREYDVPNREAGPWSLITSLVCSLVSPSHAYRVNLKGVDVETGDDLASTPDGSRIVRVRSNKAIVFFLGIRPQPIAYFSVAMPEAPDSTLTERLAKNRLCAFVCAPLTNPLNGKTVGPDRTQVKAIVRIKTWEQTSATFWIDEEYDAVHSGDVVADLHTWQSFRPEIAGSLGDNEWFAIVGQTDSDTSPPQRNVASPLERELRLSISTKRGVDRIGKVLVENPSPPVVQLQLPTTPPTARNFNYVNTPAQRSNDASDEIRAFIQRHHEKASQRDIDGMVSDYSNPTVFMSHGVVDHDFIRKDKYSYHPAGVRVSESVIMAPSIEFAEGESHIAYTIAFSRETPDGRWTKGQGEISMRLRRTANGWKILEEHIKVRDSRQGP